MTTGVNLRRRDSRHSRAIMESMSQQGGLIGRLKAWRDRSQASDGGEGLFSKVGLPRNKDLFSRRAWLVIGITAVLIALTPLLSVFSWSLVGNVNLIAVFVGAGLRLAAHGQDHPRWKVLDGLGKLIAYECSFVVVLSVFVGAPL